jgi:hypothetical protein
MQNMVELNISTIGLWKLKLFFARKSAVFCILLKVRVVLYILDIGVEVPETWA